ncbi:MAG: ABC transporter ATP-binding protein [Clostridiales bacterium]|nr:ABC transporter ATP-binding protein [Clostridiales bacterium]
MSENVLEIKNLVVHYETPDGVSEAVNDVSFSIKAGETLGLVGETGAGKTTIALTIMGLLPKPAGQVIEGEVLLDGKNIVETSRNKFKQRRNDKMMRKLRGNDIGMIFQDPMSALNPVMPVGDQIAEVVKLHNKVSKAEASKRAVEMMELVGIPGERYSNYPHEFSGGMKQRIVIAMALACNPRVLIADEPTTALDVTIQAQVLELMNGLKSKFKTALLMITHDLGVVAEICDKCAVIYAGQLVEYGTVEHIFNNAKHPYTMALFEALPSLDKDVDRLKSISGLMSDPMDLPSYCTFFDRCDAKSERCNELDPPLTEVEPGHFVRCARFMKDKQKAAVSEGAGQGEVVL